MHRSRPPAEGCEAIRRGPGGRRPARRPRSGRLPAELRPARGRRQRCGRALRRDWRAAAAPRRSGGRTTCALSHAAGPPSASERPAPVTTRWRPSCDRMGPHEGTPPPRRPRGVCAPAPPPTHASGPARHRSRWLSAPSPPRRSFRRAGPRSHRQGRQGHDALGNEGLLDTPHRRRLRR